jgi:hypothetical protein
VLSEDTNMQWSCYYSHYRNYLCLPVLALCTQVAAGPSVVADMSAAASQHLHNPDQYAVVRAMVPSAPESLCHTRSSHSSHPHIPLTLVAHRSLLSDPTTTPVPEGGCMQQQQQLARGSASPPPLQLRQPAPVLMLVYGAYGGWCWVADLSTDS